MVSDLTQDNVNRGTLLAEARAALEAAGIDTAALDARLLLEHGLGISRTALLTEPAAAVGAAEAEQVRRLVDRRAGHEPVSRIVGSRGFWTFDLALGPDTLDPRPDTETLFSAALDRYRAVPPATVLDLGTGTGCIALALASEWPEARVWGIDIAAGAVETARANAAALGLQDRATFLSADWNRLDQLDGLPRAFDVIVSNPPYIPAAEIPALAPEVRLWDPPTALDGGPDGLDAYRKLAPLLMRKLAPGGHAFLEIGMTQAVPVTTLLLGAGLRVIEVVNDLAGRPRVVSCAQDGRTPAANDRVFGQKTVVSRRQRQ